MNYKELCLGCKHTKLRLVWKHASGRPPTSYPEFIVQVDLWCISTGWLSTAYLKLRVGWLLLWTHKNCSISYIQPVLKSFNNASLCKIYVLLNNLFQYVVIYLILITHATFLPVFLKKKKNKTELIVRNVLIKKFLENLLFSLYW